MASKQLIGWMGVTLTVPGNWDLVQARGNRFDGYLRLEEDGVLRCEVQWTLVSAGRVILNEQVDRYLQSLEEYWRKRNKPITIDRDIKLVGRRQVKRNVRTFRWESGQVSYGLMWFCETCRRALVAQVTGYPHEPVRDWAKDLFLSLSDHPDGDWETWSVYGLHFQAPVGWELSGSELVPGKTRFVFRRGDYQLTVNRWGPASVLLKGQAMEEFAVQALSKEVVERFEIHYRGDEFKGHKAMRLFGKDKRSGNPLHLIWRRLHVGLPFPRFWGWLWHCEISNRLYLVTGALSPEDEPLAQHLAQSVRCHG